MCWSAVSYRKCKIPNTAHSREGCKLGCDLDVHGFFAASLEQEVTNKLLRLQMQTP